MYLLSPLALNDHWLIVFIIRTVFKRRDADQLYICAGGHNVSEGAAAERIHCCDSRVSSWVVKKSFGRLHTFHTHLGFNKRPYHWEANSGVFGSVPQVFFKGTALSLPSLWVRTETRRCYWMLVWITCCCTIQIPPGQNASWELNVNMFSFRCSSCCVGLSVHWNITYQTLWPFSRKPVCEDVCSHACLKKRGSADNLAVKLSRKHPSVFLRIVDMSFPIISSTGISIPISALI